MNHPIDTESSTEMAAPLTAALIAKQIAGALLDQYDGFDVDGTDTTASRVKAGTVQVEGTADDGGYLSFLVTVSEVEVDDPEPSYDDED